MGSETEHKMELKKNQLTLGILTLLPFQTPDRYVARRT